MDLTPEQKATISAWIAAGDNLSAVQKKLREQFNVSMTYMDVRFLVDDLNLTLKDPPKKADANDVSKSPAPPAPAPAATPGAPGESAADADAALDDDALPAPAGNVRVTVDDVTLHPGALASGSVVFSDGVTAKWIVDNYGRPGFLEVSQPGYRPSPEDGQAFMQQLDGALRQKGF